MAQPLDFNQLVGAVQVMEQSEIVNGFFKDHIAGKRDVRKQNKIHFMQQQADVDPSTWKNVDAAVAYTEMLQAYKEDA